MSVLAWGQRGSIVGYWPIIGLSRDALTRWCIDHHNAIIWSQRGIYSGKLAYNGLIGGCIDQVGIDHHKAIIKDEVS